MSFQRVVMSAAMAGSIACSAPLAAAREPIAAPVASVAVDGVDVEQVVALGAGVPLNFTVFGTPGALVTLRIDGGRRVLELRETEPGVYEGSYLIDGADAVRPESRVTATLQKHGAVAYAALDEPLLLAKGTVPWGVAATPAETTAPPAPLTGMPVPEAVAAETTLPIPIAVTPRQPQPVPPPAFAATPPRGATSTGRIDSTTAQSLHGARSEGGGVIGAIGGAIAGAILGKELGEAHKQRMLTLLGAIGGGLAGRQVERQATQSTQYDVDLRLADGTVLKRRYEQPPPFAAGATIRLGTPSRVAPAPTL